MTQSIPLRFPSRSLPAWIFFVLAVWGSFVEGSAPPEDLLLPSQMQEILQAQFDAVTPASKKIVFLKTVRYRKYESTKKDIVAFQKFVSGYSQDFDTIQSKLMRLYKTLLDKINWIDEFKSEEPQVFSGRREADRYFKSTKSVVEDILEIKVK